MKTNMNPFEPYSNEEKVKRIQDSLNLSKTVRTSAPYKMFLILKDKEVPWNNREIVAIKLVNRFIDLIEGLPDQDIESLSESIVEAYRVVYEGLMDDLQGSNIQIEELNKIFRELINL